MLKLQILSCLKASGIRLTQEERRDLYGIVSRYLVRLSDAKQMKKALLKLGGKTMQGQKTRGELLKCGIEELKKETFDRMEYYLRGLWRAVHEKVRYGLRTELVASMYGVEMRDVRFVFRHLSEVDHQRIRRIQHPTRMLPKAALDRMLKEIENYAKGLAGFKVKFISKNDVAFSRDDFVQEFISEGWRAILRYEHLKDEAHILNTAKRSVHNFAINQIHFHRAEVRTVLRDVKSGPKKTLYSTEVNGVTFYADTEKELMRKIPRGWRDRVEHISEVFGYVENQNEREYDRPKVPIEDTYVIQCEDGGAAMSPVEFDDAGNGTTPEREAMDDALMEALREAKLSERVLRFVNIIIGGEIDEDFGKWLHKFYRVRVEDIMEDYTELGEYAREYLNISQKKLVKALGIKKADDGQMVIETLGMKTSRGA